MRRHPDIGRLEWAALTALGWVALGAVAVFEALGAWRTR